MRDIVWQKCFSFVNFNDKKAFNIFKVFQALFWSIKLHRHNYIYF